MATFEIPDGWCVQAFRFTLDPTEDQARSLARHFGARRKAYNWTVATLKADIGAWRVTGIETAKPSLRALRKRWNSVKSDICVNAETGAVWWPECSKEAYPGGIAGAVDAYWNWQTSRSGKRAGNGSGSRGSSARAATRIGCVSPPARCASNRIAGISRCR
jgi:putative transposase